MFKEEVFPFKHISSGISPLFPILEFVEQLAHPVVSLSASSLPVVPPSLNNTDNVGTPSPTASIPLTHGQSQLSLPASPHVSFYEPFAPSTVLRRSSRLTKLTVQLEDYVVPPNKLACPYPMSNYVTYDYLTPAYRSSTTAFLAILEPRSSSEASKDPKWVEVMQAEITTLEENNTWSIVLLPPGKVLIGCKWVFKVMYKSSREVERYKVILVAKNYSQQEGLDYTETFSPVAKMAIVRVVVALATASCWYVF